MHDPFLSQAWADRHDAFSTFFAGLLRDTWTAFERLAARTYDAPWRLEEKRRRSPAAVKPNRAQCR